MPATAYPSSSLWSQRYLKRLLTRARPTNEHFEEEKRRLWDAIASSFNTPTELTRLKIELADLYSEQAEAERDLLLLAVGTLCLKHDQRALWTEVYDAANDCPQPDEELAFLQETTAKVRARQL